MAHYSIIWWNILLIKEKSMRFFIVLLLPTLLLAQGYCEVNAAKVFGTMDSVFLKDEVDPGLYSTMRIMRGNDTLFKYSNANLELEAEAPLSLPCDEQNERSPCQKPQVQGPYPRRKSSGKARVCPEANSRSLDSEN